MPLKQKKVFMKKTLSVLNTNKNKRLFPIFKCFQYYYKTYLKLCQVLFLIKNRKGRMSCQGVLNQKILNMTKGVMLYLV